MYKFKDKSLARYRYKQKQTPWNLDLGYTCMLYSVTKLVSNIPHFPQVGLCEAPGGMSRWSFELVYEILKVPIYVRVFFIPSIRNLDLQNAMYCITIEGNIKRKSQSFNMAKLSRPSLMDVYFLRSGFIWHSSGTELFASVSTTAYSQVFNHSVVNWWNTLLINCAY